MTLKGEMRPGQKNISRQTELPKALNFWIE